MAKRLVTMTVLMMLLTACEQKPFDVSRIHPEIGLTQGGEKVVVYGSGFDADNTPTIYFGNRRVRKLGVTSDDTLWVNTPAMDRPMKVDVKVVAGDGTQFVIPMGFEFMRRDKMAECVNISKQLNGTFGDGVESE